MVATGPKELCGAAMLMATMKTSVIQYNHRGHAAIASLVSKSEHVLSRISFVFIEAQNKMLLIKVKNFKLKLC